MDTLDANFLFEMQMLMKIEKIKDAFSKLNEDDKMEILDEGILNTVFSTIKSKILTVGAGSLEKSKMLSFLDRLIKEKDKIPSDPKLAEAHIKNKIKNSGANIAVVSSLKNKILKGILVSSSLLNILNPFAWMLAFVIALVTDSKGEAFGSRMVRMVNSSWKLANRQQDKDSAGGKLIWWSVFHILTLGITSPITMFPIIFYGLKFMSQSQYAAVVIDPKEIAQAKQMDNLITSANEAKATPGANDQNT